jgi:transposase
MKIIFVGIDISQKKIDVHYEKAGKKIDKNIVNDWDKLNTFALELKAETEIEYHVVLEHSGTYSTKAIYALCENGIKVSVITPNQSNSFAKMKNYTTKNDQADARLLAEYGRFNASDLPLYQLPSEEQSSIKVLLTTIAQAEKMLQSSKNQEHAHIQLPKKLQQASVLAFYKTTQNHLQEQLDLLQKNLDKYQLELSEDLQEQKKK